MKPFYLSTETVLPFKRNVYRYVKALGRYLKTSSSGAARNAARLAAENRARRSTSDTHYL